VSSPLALFATLTHLYHPFTARRDYPVTADEYELLEECGRGVSATVRREKREAKGRERGRA
jgi:hypothetical protein